MIKLNTLFYGIINSSWFRHVNIFANKMSKKQTYTCAYEKAYDVIISNNFVLMFIGIGLSVLAVNYLMLLFFGVMMYSTAIYINRPESTRTVHDATYILRLWSVYSNFSVIVWFVYCITGNIGSILFTFGTFVLVLCFYYCSINQIYISEMNYMIRLIMNSNDLIVGRMLYVWNEYMFNRVLQTWNLFLEEINVPLDMVIKNIFTVKNKNDHEE